MYKESHFYNVDVRYIVNHSNIDITVEGHPFKLPKFFNSVLYEYFKNDLITCTLTENNVSRSKLHNTKWFKRKTQTAFFLRDIEIILFIDEDSNECVWYTIRSNNNHIM